MGEYDRIINRLERELESTDDMEKRRAIEAELRDLDRLADQEQRRREEDEFNGYR